MASAALRGPIRFALLQQIPVAVVCALMLDGGTMAKVCGAAVVGFWIGAGLLLARRGQRPSRSDIAFIRWGFFPLLATAFVGAALWARWIAP